VEYQDKCKSIINDFGGDLLIVELENVVFEAEQEIELLRSLCLEFASLGRVSNNNNNALSMLCRQWSEHQEKRSISSGV